MRNRTHSKSMCKWIIDLEASKYDFAFDTYEIIAPRNVHLNQNIIAKALEWDLSL